MLVRLRAVAALAIVAALVVPPGVFAQDESRGTPAFAEPSISPDGGEIAFVSGGDIWSVPAAGGTARLLAATGGWASRPLFSPDGTRLAFVSTRPGAGGVYVVALAGGALTRVTHDDAVPTLDGWSRDGRYVLFQTSAHNIAYMNDIMRVRSDGGTPVRALGERYVNAMDAAESPDRSALVYVRNGYLQWWRRGRSHIDESEITIARLAGAAGNASGSRTTYETVTNGDAKDRWPMWAPDGRTLYFVSDRSGHDEIWASAS
ncbi:MAG: PD40 domain-containing protein [Candidatus Eremiobacteraeota bacterium]|nr:PD40 domain-containing protein [Candidatus Eremiobacteraeota bacterium]